VIDEFVWQSDLSECRIYLSFAKVLANSSADAANLDAILDCDNQSVLG
jgi:hypothetical protein